MCLPKYLFLLPKQSCWLNYLRRNTNPSPNHTSHLPILGRPSLLTRTRTVPIALNPFSLHQTSAPPETPTSNTFHQPRCSYVVRKDCVTPVTQNFLILIVALINNTSCSKLKKTTLPSMNQTHLSKIFHQK